MDEETKLVIKTMHLAYLVQRLTDYCVFINFSGHVNNLSISIRESKQNWQTKIVESEFNAAYANWRNKNESAHIAELKARIEVLERILTEKNIPFDELAYEEEYIRHYTLDPLEN